MKEKLSKALLAEFVGTFALIFVGAGAGALGLGGLVGVALALVGGPLTGAALNPARTLGPAFASGNFADLWLYMAGPLTGGVAAALLYRGVLSE